jgi:hypothetical protein
LGHRAGYVVGGCLPRGLGSGATETMSGAFHVAFRCGGAWVEVFKYQSLFHVRAPFEEPLAYGFEKGGDAWVAQRLVCKLDGIGACTDRMRECSNVGPGRQLLGDTGQGTF